MNSMKSSEWQTYMMFPSPTRVNHYESMNAKLRNEVVKFPSPTGVNHYEFERYALKKLLDLEFPSPTGVNHYE